MDTSFGNAESRFAAMGDGSLRGGGMDYQAFMYGARSRRTIKREDSKEGYKLPHRLIEKKRRDRINECIVQLKELLPENLKLATLGHLEKAVVLELTVQHMQALTALSQQQKEHIAALQSGEASPATRSPPPSSPPPPSPQPPSTPALPSLSYSAGYESCAREVMSYLGRADRAPGSRLLGHLQRAVGRVDLDPVPPADKHQQQQLLLPAKAQCLQQRGQQTHFAGDDEAAPRRNCVPVIQRACANTAGDVSSSDDTDTDSGYGGEGERDGVAKREGAGGDGSGPPAAPGPAAGGRTPPLRIKREADAQATPPCAVKRPRAASPPTEWAGAVSRGPPPPLCLPFYLLPPSAAYLQLLREKSGLHDYPWPAQPFPFAYGPGLHHQQQHHQQHHHQQQQQQQAAAAAARADGCGSAPPRPDSPPHRED